MNILFIEDHAESRDVIYPVLANQPDANVMNCTSLQEGIEAIEQRELQIDLVICDYHGPSSALLKCLITVVHDVAGIVVIESSSFLAGTTYANRNPPLEFIDRSKLAKDLPKTLERFLKKNVIKASKTPDSEFVRVAASVLLQISPFKSDIYIKLASDKYCKLFKRGDQFELDELEQYLKKKEIEYFYIHKDQADELLEKKNERLETLGNTEPIPAIEARKEASDALGIIFDALHVIGFTPEVQKMAKRSAELTVKALGSNPKLSAILLRMKQDEGLYIASHSLVLAEIASAIACKIGWTSASSYLKLSIAAFLHDLALKDHEVARFQLLSEIQAGDRFTSEEVQKFKFHPLKASEFAQNFHEIPPDVDTILLQHHERPDGSGFPRGLSSKQIAPLSCVFIMAHDLLHYFLDHGKEGTLEGFLAIRKDLYSTGVFKKIFLSLHSGISISA